MNKTFTDKINVYITVDSKAIHNYFNVHDPSPLYKKELAQKFEYYILNAVCSAKRYSAIFYKLNCLGAVNKQFSEPLLYAVQRHFNAKKSVREKEFKKFKRRNFTLLAISSFTVILLEALLPMVISQQIGVIYNGLKNCLDIFSWVILWQPIYQLIFGWNSFLKDILLFKKLAAAEILLVDEKTNADVEKQPVFINKNEAEAKKSYSLESIFSN